MRTDEESTHSVYSFKRDATATKEQAIALLKQRTETVINVARDRAQRAPVTQEQFQQLLGKLDRIEKRLDAIEKKGDKK